MLLPDLLLGPPDPILRYQYPAGQDCRPRRARPHAAVQDRGHRPLSRSLLSLVLLAAMPVSGIAAGPRSPDTPHVVLITLDTTRADRLGAYGWAAARTPALDRLAADGGVFEGADTSAPMTLPAHATMLTGLEPARPRRARH